jgi:superfamily I DNA/RNA helicase
MFDAISTYQTLLNDRGQLDWSDVPRRMWTYIQDSVISLPQYDVILIDEAQFFAPLWFDLLKGMVKPERVIFLSSLTQPGFLRRGGSWRSLGLEARGRSQQLRKSYRSTQEILNLATLFYRLRVPNETDQDILAPDLMNMPNGVLPALIPLASRQDENARVVNEIEAIIKQGMQKRHCWCCMRTGRELRH